MSEEPVARYQMGQGVDSTIVHEIERIVGGNSYLIKYKELNGDAYERILYKSGADSRNDEAQRQKLLSEYIRAAMLVEVAGEPYKTGSERFMPVWLMVDVNNFVLEYLSGNL